MRIERPLNNFCRGGQLLHDAMQRQTERDIKRMRRWAEEDARAASRQNSNVLSGSANIDDIDYQDIARGVLSDIFGGIKCNNININSINIIIHK